MKLRWNALVFRGMFWRGVEGEISAFHFLESENIYQ